MINPLSKSEWITPAHWGAVIPFLKVQALTSSSPTVKKVLRPKISYEALATLSRPDKLVPSISKYSRRSVSFNNERSSSTFADTGIASAPSFSAKSNNFLKYLSFSGFA